MEVDEGNEPVLYLGETHPGNGKSDDSFDVEMAELRNSIKAGGSQEGGEQEGVRAEGGEERTEQNPTVGGVEGVVQEDGGEGGEQGGDGDGNEGQYMPGREVPDPDPEIIIADPEVIKPRYN